jgi:hypothetical protein
MSNTDLIGDFETGAEGSRGIQLKNVRVGRAQISSRGDIDLQDVTIGPCSGEVLAYYGTIRRRDVVLIGNADVLGRHVALRRATSAADANGIMDTWVEARRRLSLVDSNVVQIVSGKARLVESTCQHSFVAASL